MEVSDGSFQVGIKRKKANLLGVDSYFTTLSWADPLGGFPHGAQFFYEPDQMGYAQ